MSSSARAAYDALELAGRLAEQGERGFTAGELHSLAYLGCLLAVYDGREPRWWGYTFTATTTGAPYALALAEAVDRLLARERLAETDVVLLTRDGREELDALRGFAMNERRARYLAGACDAAIALPLPSVTEAISYEPQMASGVELGVKQPLLDETGLELVRPHLEALREALGERPGGTMMVPAVLWLTYLAEAAGLLTVPEVA